MRKIPFHGLSLALALSALFSASCRQDELPMHWTQARQAEINVAAASCSESGHPASGPELLQCIDDVAWPAGRQHRVQEYLETVRNFTCARNDTGTPPKFTKNVTLESDYEACPAYSPLATPTVEAGLHEDFLYLPGMLPAGKDLTTSMHEISAKKAAELCAEAQDCKGFTFRALSPRGPAFIWFKTSLEGFMANPGDDNAEMRWHTYRRKSHATTCRAEPRTGSTVLGESQTFTVDLIREKPLVAVIRGFASEGECDELVHRGGDWATMSRSFTLNGTTSAERQSYGTELTPNLHDPADLVTRIVSRMFAITRSLTGFAVYPPGQEPLEVVLYRDLGDEYRPHCDADTMASCLGGKYEKGERVATTILYCRIPKLGGGTTFTTDALKVVPRSGDMLLFTYWLGGELMVGKDGEHSGCPIQKGQKWVATQWYREGVDFDWTWEEASVSITR